MLNFYMKSVRRGFWVNGFYLPKKSSTDVNEIMLINILKKEYWCPKCDDIKVLNCVRAPVKEVL